MSTVLHKDVTVGPGGKIEIAIPELQPGQRVSVTIETHQGESAPLPHALDRLNAMQPHRLFKTAEEVDAYLQAERESWDR